MSKGFKDAIRISITLEDIDDKDAKEILDKMFKKYKKKIYFAHYYKCKILR